MLTAQRNHPVGLLRFFCPVRIFYTPSTRHAALNAVLSFVRHDQIIKDAKDGVRDSAQLVIVSYDLATRMVEKSLLWKGQVRDRFL